MTELNLEPPQFKEFLSTLRIPNSCVLNKPLYKKMFQDYAELDTKDKKALRDDIDKVRWLYTLKSDTINIAPYEDNLRDYGELAFLQVDLRSSKSIERIGHLINRAIPYPIVIFFVLDESKQRRSSTEKNKSDEDTQLVVCLADKRINKADKQRWVIETLLLTPWISLTEPTDNAQTFVNSMAIASLPHSDFWRLYQALIARVQGLQCAVISGRFHVTSYDALEEQRQQLKTYRLIEQKIKKLRSQLKQAEFSQQVVLNTQIKQYEIKLKQITERL